MGWLASLDLGFAAQTTTLASRLDGGALVYLGPVVHPRIGWAKQFTAPVGWFVAVSVGVSMQFPVGAPHANPMWKATFRQPMQSAFTIGFESGLAPGGRSAMRAVGLVVLTFAAVVLTACEPECEPVPPGALGELTTLGEKEFIAQKRLPPVTDWELLIAEDGLPLAYTDWVPRTGTAAVPPCCSSTARRPTVRSTRPSGKGLAEEGVFARLIDLRGHGYSRCLAPGRCDPTDTPTYEESETTWPGRPGDKTLPSQQDRQAPPLTSSQPH